MQPWPVAFTELVINASKPPLRLAIKETSICESPSAHLQPGELVLDDGLGVATADRVIRILRLQPSGKKEMQGVEFLRGHQPAAGTRLG